MKLRLPYEFVQLRDHLLFWLFFNNNCITNVFEETANRGKLEHWVLTAQVAQIALVFVLPLHLLNWIEKAVIEKPMQLVHLVHSVRPPHFLS